MIKLDVDAINAELKRIRQEIGYTIEENKDLSHEKEVELARSRLLEKKTGVELKELPNKYPELYELLGGKKLIEVFDDSNHTIGGIISEFVILDRLHLNIKETRGIEILEGLLNKQIVGNLGQFFNVSPSYILGLPNSEQEKLAKTFSESHEDLENALKIIWRAWNKNYCLWGRWKSKTLYSFKMRFF